ncbi:MAG: hypothetical protein JSR59_19575 [Proteobacteria bacterium]|nr:hypothetical protein [Pseudomonadota bacterium]
MSLPLQFIAASLLVAFGVAIVIAWLLLFVLALDHMLLPWVNAGILLYGLGVVALASIVTVPGIMWAQRLSERVPHRWKRQASLPTWIGTAVLSTGAVVALLALFIGR